MLYLRVAAKSKAFKSVSLFFVPLVALTACASTSAPDAQPVLTPSIAATSLPPTLAPTPTSTTDPALNPTPIPISTSTPKPMPTENPPPTVTPAPTYGATSTPQPTIPKPTPTPPLPASQKDIRYGQYSSQQLDVYTKETFVDASILVLVHGGGWDRGDKAGGSLGEPRGEEGLLVDFFNELGFVVMSPNYRLVTEDGRFTFPTAINDVSCAVAWIKRNAATYGGDGSSLIIMGHSAGAHIGAMVAYNGERNRLEDCGNQEEFTLNGFIGSSGLYDFDVVPREVFEVGCFLKDLLALEACGEGDTRWKDGDSIKLAKASPITFVSPGDPPALLITGENDCFVNVPDPITGFCTTNVVRMGAALDKLGINNEVLIVPIYHHNGYMTPEIVGQELVDFLESVR